jgi:hypothetical protein
MTYAVFRFVPGNEAKERIKAISLLMLIGEDKLTGADIGTFELKRKKPSSNKTEELAGFLACYLANVPTVSLIKLPKKLKTDKHLVGLGKDYLGCISTPLKKPDLVRMIESVILVEDTKYLNSRFGYPLDVITPRVNSANLTPEEDDELRKIYEKSIDPVKEWIDKRVARLEKLNSDLEGFLVMGF